MKTLFAILLFAFTLPAQDKIIATPDGIIGDMVHLTFSDGTMDLVATYPPCIPTKDTATCVHDAIVTLTQVPHIIYDRYVPLVDWKTDPQKIIAEVKTYLDLRNNSSPKSEPTLEKPVEMTTVEISIKQNEIIIEKESKKSNEAKPIENIISDPNVKP